MRSKWLDSASSTENIHDESSSDARVQTSTSGRHHGPRWFSVVQGIRRSLDVHLKSYYKIDSAFASTLRHVSASDKLKALTRAVIDTGLVDFCCVYLVHPARGTFGVVALCGVGAELYPPCLADDEAQRPMRQCDSGLQSFPNVFTRCVFQVNDSNWCVEDVVASKAPWYYDCASAANGFGLPQDGGWLRRVGMRSVLALPCMQGNDVTGVLAVASKAKSLDHLLLRKLEELCFKITPTVTDAVVQNAPLLCNRRVASRYESITDFAHEVLGEMLNLDRAVAASVSSLNRSAANVSQPACGAGACRARKGAEKRPAFDATAAAAAAAAAGFTWTAPSAAAVAASAPAVMAAADTACALAQPSILAPDTFFTAPMEDDESYSVVLTADLASATLPHVEVTSMISLDISERPTQAAAPLPLVPLESAAANPSAGTQAAQPIHGSQSQSHGWSRPPHVGTSRSLPERMPASAAGGAAMDFLRGCAGDRHHRPHAQQQQQQPGGASGAASSADRNASRSTRSLSCLEFSGSTTEVREELACGSSGNSGQAAAAVAAPAGSVPKCAAASSGVDGALRVLRAPPQQPFPEPHTGARAGGATPGSSKRSTESGTGEGYMIDSRSTEELAAALRNGCSAMMSPSPAWSWKNMESRIMQRGAPLEASVGGPSTASAAPAPAAPPLAAARGSSCATDCSTAAADTATTFAYANSSQNTCSAYASTAPAARLSVSASASQGCCGVSDLGEVRTSLRGVAPGRWSRDSAAAAAAVWNNEAAEAVAAAMRYTAEQADDCTASRCGGGAAAANEPESPFWTARAGASSATEAACSRGFRGTAAGLKAVLGGLYGIRESGPMPSLPLSLEFSDSDDGGVALMDLTSSSSPDGGFLLSSGLGEEALRRQREGRGSGCSRLSSGTQAQPLSQALEALATSPCDKADLIATVSERLAGHA